jgi:membrane protease subunit HflC
LVFALAIVILAVLLIYPVSYQVRFNEMVVVTTFGKADKSSVKNADPDPAHDESGLYWKWPWPIQDVHTFDKRVQVLEDRIEEQQTLDKKAVIVSAYVTWRVVDPLAFYSAVGDLSSGRGEQQIRNRLRDARSVLGNFTMDELTSSDAAKLRLGDAEAAILKKLRENLQSGGQALGIAVESVGIKRLILPQSVSEAVFNHMKATRERLAQSARSSGDAAAANIKAAAESARLTIRAFAERRAQSLRAEGDQAAQEYFSVFKQDEQFAAFLRRMTAYREVLRNNTTFLIDAKEGLFGEFLQAPGATPTPAAPAAAPAGGPKQ